MTPNSIQCFEKSGLAKLSDLTVNSYELIFHFLEQEQNNYFQLSNSLINHDYFKKWPKDTLHWWSRIWEYPYVYYHVQKLLDEFDRSPVKVMDFGSGVNFFPISISNLGCEVTCIDNDPLCIESLKNIVATDSELAIRPVLNQGIQIPFPDKTFEIIYSVSVFEHIPDLINLIAEIDRILTDNGYLIITFDVSLNENFDLTLNKYYKFIDTVFKHFELHMPYRSSHPADTLTSKNSPIPFSGYKLKNRVTAFVINYLIRPLLLKAPHTLPSTLMLSVEGMVVKKRR